MLAVALSFLAGISLAQQLPVLPGIDWLLVGLAATLTMLAIRFYRLAFFLFGMLWAIAFAGERLSDRLLPSHEGHDLQIQGVIDGLPEYSSTGVRFNFIVSSEQSRLPAKIRLSWHQPERPVKAGQQWQFTVRLKRPHGHLNPGGFDYERWLFSEGIGATGYVRPSPQPILIGTKASWRSLDAWRQAISDRLTDLIADPEGRGLIKALGIGDDNDINPRQWQLFRDTGTTHLMVISGSHVGLIAGLIYGLIRKTWARSGILKWSPAAVAAVPAMLGAVFYSLLAGFSIPTRRAVIMVSVAMLALILQRHYRPWHTLSLALIALLIFDPLAVLSAGFWLSFLAVALIIIAVSGRLRPPGLALGAVKIHWYAAAGLTPLLMLYFQQTSPLSPLANLIAVPVVTLLAVPLSLLGIVLMWPMPEVAQAIFKIDIFALDALTKALATLADTPFATVAFRQPSWSALALTVPAVVLLLAPAGTPSRWLSLVMILPLLATEADRPKPGEMHLTLLDVGQGLAAVVRTADHWLVYDAGSRFSDHYDMGQNVVLPFLRARGAEHIDRLVVSHGDNDHIGGAPSLLNGLKTDGILTSVPEALGSYHPLRCRAGQRWQWDGVKFEVLSPSDENQGSENDRSCVLLISSRFGSMLMPGDIETESESRLVAVYGNRLKSDILIAPHHGSRSSSSQAFLNAVKPSHVLIPSGYRNPFGHPHADVLARYGQLHSAWLISSNSGAIDVEWNGNGPKISALRLSEKRYWRNKP